MKKVSCIMPAYTEGTRILSVLNVAIGHPLIDEIIVIDDGSTDNTKDIVKNLKGITLLEYDRNQGKSKAVYTGITNATGEFILMLDTDLIRLTRENITNLIEPVINGKADISISLRGNAPGFWKKIGIDFLSGERVFKKELLKDHLEKLPKLRGYGLEVFLNRIIIKNKCSIRIVRWKGVASPIKYRKLWKIFKVHDFLYMVIEIMKNISIFEIVSQVVKMRKLIVK